MSDTQAKPPVWYWILAVIGLLWFAFGAWVYISVRFAIAPLPEEQGALYEAFPLWQNIAWGLSVWTALAGAILLIVRMKMAALMFLIALVSYVIYAIYIFGMANGFELLGGAGAGLSAVIFLSILGFFWLARSYSSSGILK